MNVWLAVALILAVASVYMLLIEVFSVAFKLTGLATNKIRLQVASLFTGTGFTTAESELIVNDERRRKIAVTCAYVGHIFSVVIMGLVINVFFSIGFSIGTEPVEQTFTEWYFIIFYVALGIFLFVLFLKIPPVNRRFQKFLESIAINSSKHSKKNNIITVLDMYGKHAIAKVVLNNIPEYAVDKSLSEMELTRSYSINILSVKRGKRIIDVTKDTMFKKGDTLVLYGFLNDINEAFINSTNNNKKVDIDRSNEISLVSNYGQNALVEVYVDEVPEMLKGATVEDLQLNNKYRITLVVIKRNDEFIPPNKDLVIQKGDLVTLIGPYKNIKLIFTNEEKGKNED